MSDSFPGMKNTIEVVSKDDRIPDQKDIDYIIEKVKEGKKHGRQFIQCIIDCGQRCNKVKDEIGHGNWMTWVKDHEKDLGFGYRTVKRWMECSETYLTHVSKFNLDEIETFTKFYEIVKVIRDSEKKDKEKNDSGDKPQPEPSDNDNEGEEEKPEPEKPIDLSCEKFLKHLEKTNKLLYGHEKELSYMNPLREFCRHWLKQYDKHIENLTPNNIQPKVGGKVTISIPQVDSINPIKHCEIQKINTDGYLVKEIKTGRMFNILSKEVR
jgi:hypothetical protein